MNLLSPPRARLPIEVVFDLVCPWCFLGTRRLRRALRARPDILAEIHWPPFLLNPDIAREGMPRQDYFVRKFGGEERARDAHGPDRPRETGHPAHSGMTGARQESEHAGHAGGRRHGSSSPLVPRPHDPTWRAERMARRRAN